MGSEEQGRASRTRKESQVLPMAQLTKAGRYQIVREIGRGSMGVVYQGFDPVIGRGVAIKTIKTEGLSPAEYREYKARFHREAQAAGVLVHPNILTIYDFGEDEGTLYLAMELLSGKTLQQLLEERGMLPVDTIVPIFEQVGSALDRAHRHQVIHRDIKPGNIMVLDDGLVKVTDFGIAKLMSASMTRAGLVLGSPSYMSPEQIKGLPIDGRADIFSLGVVLYECLTGTKPFPGQNISTIIYKIIHEEPAYPPELDREFHPGIRHVINKALAKRPEDRYQTCREMTSDLKNYRSIGTAAEPTGIFVAGTAGIAPPSASEVAPPATSKPEVPPIEETMIADSITPQLIGRPSAPASAPPPGVAEKKSAPAPGFTRDQAPPPAQPRIEPSVSVFQEVPPEASAPEPVVLPGRDLGPPPVTPVSAAPAPAAAGHQLKWVVALLLVAIVGLGALAWVLRHRHAGPSYGIIAGRISSVSGDPLSGVRIVLRNQNSGQVTHVATDTTGAYKATGLAPGTYRLTVEAPESFISKEISDLSLSGSQTLTEDVALAPAPVEPGELAGKILDSRGRPLAHRQVKVVSQATQSVLTVETDARGNYRIPNLPPGTYDVSLEPGADQLAASKSDVHLGPGESARLDLTASKAAATAPPPSQPSGGSTPPRVTAVTATVHGRVFDENGAGLTGASVRIIDAQRKVAKAVVSDSAGNFRITDLAPGNYHLEVQPQGFSPTEATQFALTKGQDYEVNIRVKELAAAKAPAPPPPPSTGTLNGKVVDEHGAAIQGLRIRLVREGNGQSAKQLTTDDKGAFTASDLTAGTYDIQVEPSSLYPAKQVQGVVVKPGETVTQSIGLAGPIIRFPVAHWHRTTGCYGYLYITRSTIRYEEKTPPNNRDHSFELPSASLVSTKQWSFLFKPFPAVELKFKNGKSYPFFYIRESLLNQPNPTLRYSDALPWQDLERAVKDYDAALALAKKQAAANSASPNAAHN